MVEVLEMDNREENVNNTDIGLPSTCMASCLKRKKVSAAQTKSAPLNARRKLDFGEGDMETRTASVCSEYSELPSVREKSTQNLLNELHEEERQRFLEKYNFDVVLEVPKPGRFIWEKVEDSLPDSSIQKREQLHLL